MAKAPIKVKTEQNSDVAEPLVAPEATGILGYTALSPDVVDLINDHKTWEEQILRRIDWLYTVPNVNGRHIAIAHAHFEIAFAMLTKGTINAPRINLTDDTARHVNPG